MLLRKCTWKIRKQIGRLVADATGAMLVYATLLLPVLFGGAVLVIDGARLSHLNTDLQKGADALALVGAAELDRRPDALTRANAAIANMTSNKHKFGTKGTVEVTVSAVRFLKSLPASDASAITSVHETSDPALARFIEVTVAPQSMNTIFPATFIGAASNSATTGARAVAGFNRVACKFTPLYICNPYQGSTTTTIFDAAKDPAQKRRQIELRKQGGTTAQNSPGNYGFLLPPDMADDPTLDGKGASALREMIGRVNPPACFEQNGVELKTGFISSVQQAINVRFDMYEGSMNSSKGNAEFRPARNVRKGYSYKGNACNPAQQGPPDYSGLPRDDCFATSSCTGMNGRMGNGNWDCATYWSINFGHSGIDPPPSCTATPTASRYDIYRYEIDHNLIDKASRGGEQGTPACYSAGAGTLNDDPDRRILYGAVLDCSTLPSGASGGSVPVVTFAKFFLTEPVPGSGDNSIFVELVGLVEPGSATDDVLHDIVQLYR